ncbi:GAF domain-containing protein [Halostella litorea]|uniref:GAF domain-containing protein n=1 Tax=Halostella litorea TaxID=2528831 RepID=UPI001091D128|nr:GAF domain-containing protein [Halostella litorea]
MILCVDPDDRERERTAEALAAAGFDTRTAGSVAEAREVLADGPALDCLVVEHALPDGTGLELVRAARETAPDAACIVFTDRGIEEIDTAAFGDVVAEYLPKDGPDARDELVALVEGSLAFHSQTAYPVPENEDARVAALERYASDPDALGASFDRLAELATALFDLDAAAVGLVDAHEQRFLACHGVSFDPIPREETVCTYAILDGDVTVFEDVRDDPRFEDNEGLAAASIRFYASAPLVTPDGEAIGTFCVYDDAPREFSDRDRELLTMLADEALDQLELRRRLRERGGEGDA